MVAARGTHRTVDDLGSAAVAADVWESGGEDGAGRRGVGSEGRYERFGDGSRWRAAARFEVRDRAGCDAGEAGEGGL